MEKYEGKLVMADQRNWLLCFEYVCNGSLDKHITDATHGLNWRERYRIIRGICEGLLFLHEMRILHLDLKPANILLDCHMVPKIADFGISRCLGEDQTRAITENLHGTLGYMDPEYLRSGQIAFASDIYSLGVVIMEILTGAKRYLEDENVVESWMNRLDASDGGMQLEQLRVCSKIGIECMNLDPKKRPVARHIIDRLDKTTSADYSEETCIGSSLFERQVSLSRQQFGERTGKLGSESLQEQEHSEILEDDAEHLGWLELQEGQQKMLRSLSWGEQDMKENVNSHGTSNFSSIFTGFSELEILDIFNRKAHTNFDRNGRRSPEKSHFINIFTKEELQPILRSESLIAKGGFCEVFKGVVGNAQVVIKKPINLLGNEKIENEVIIQSKIIHKNIVWLIGLCLEMDTPILVYECLFRGSLHDILHTGRKVPLNLDVRLNIVTELAHGLAYMHSQIILHGCVNPANILLDDNFIPKISDFGLSTLIGRDEKLSCSIIGDMTYIDPVFLQTGVLTKKSDVYSFGVVILELISRKKATQNDINSLVMSFLEVNDKGKKATKLFDKEIAVTGNLELLGCLAEIAVECLNLDVYQRLSMTDVVERLVILNRSRRLHAQHISADYSDVSDDYSDVSADYSDVVDINNLFVEQKKEDTDGSGASISSSISSGFYKLNNFDIFNRKARTNFGRNSRCILEKSHYIKIFRKELVMPMLKVENLIGKGAFSVVYKGVIDSAMVAVKKPINMQENEQFENEVIVQSQVVHKNILRLIGCCLEMDSPVLVYEFLSNGSLHDILHNRSEVLLNLDVRLTIVAESAQCLAYLHSQAHSQILHGDIKLDGKFIPKISKFGRSIARRREQTYIMDDISYVDPVYLQTGLLTGKSDVYSFGIVVLEVISGKMATQYRKHNLLRSFREVHEEGKKATDLFDKEIAVAGNLDILDTLAEIAVECVNLDVDQRPMMTDVAERLLTLQRYHRSQAVRQ